MQFKIGDKVKITEDVGPTNTYLREFNKGQVGEVYKLDEGGGLPTLIGVTFPATYVHNFKAGVFYETELEKCN